MCPLCIGTALVLWSGAGSASGVAGIVLRSVKRKRAVRDFPPPNLPLHAGGGVMQGSLRLDANQVPSEE
jgi:hypothetical protein